MKLTPGGEQALLALYEGNAGRFNIGFDRFKEVMQGWNVWVLNDGGIKAVIVERNGYGHVTKYGNEYVGLRRMKFAMNALGISKTAVMNNYRAGHALAKRLGFKKCGIDERSTYYERDKTTNQAMGG